MNKNNFLATGIFFGVMAVLLKEPFGAHGCEIDVGCKGYRTLKLE